VDYIENYVVVARSSVTGTDEVVVKIGLNNIAKTRLSHSDLIKDLKDRFRARIRVAPEIEIHDVEVIRQINFPAKSRKPIKFIDER